MKPLIYVETTVLSYLAARPARDVVSLSRQELSRDFWEWAPSCYKLCSSALVRDEIVQGNVEAAQRRLSFFEQCHLLPEATQVLELANKLIEIKAIPQTEPEDAAHIALATLSKVTYIVSWNFSHMVSPQAKRQLERAITALGFQAPILATPEEIYEAEAR